MWTDGRRGFAIADPSAWWDERGVRERAPRRLRAVSDRRRDVLAGPPGHDGLAEGPGERLSSCAARSIHVRKGAQLTQMLHGVPMSASPIAVFCGVSASPGYYSYVVPRGGGITGYRNSAYPIGIGLPDPVAVNGVNRVPNGVQMYLRDRRTTLIPNGGQWHFPGRRQNTRT